ncbi:MAG: hypothetical protein LBV12_05780 [Puniceicoccales bacterium]|jgi:heptosyltransferase-2|nr:hypothetical protein [Puniceicoccales bacterium]
MSDVPITNDSRPKTVVLHQYAGIGDFVFHLPYFRAIAEKSRSGKVSIIASPSTFARELVTAEPWVDEVIYYDHHPRRTEKRKGRHEGMFGLWRMAQDLRERNFGRIILFSPKFNRGLLAWLSRIPLRLGYGFGFLQRIFLNAPPYIKPYRGEALCVYNEATAMAMAHGFCTEPLVPRLRIPEKIKAAMESRFSNMPRPLYVFAIGTSAPNKQWGARCFGELAHELIKHGCGVILSGGPGEESLAAEIMALVPEEEHKAITAFTRGTILESATLLSIADACIGNDTGIVNVAAACERPSYVLIGSRPILNQDPLLVMIRAKTLTEISVGDVMKTLETSNAPGFDSAG